MSTTGQALITDALKAIGVVSAGEAPTSGESDDALTALNRMIDAWAAERLSIYAVVRTTKTLASGTQDYTIGSGGSINIVRPVSIDAAGIVIDTTASPVTEVPIEIFTVQRWEQIRQKALSASPAQGIYFDKAFAAGLGTISVYPKPDVATTQLVLYCPTALTSVALATTYTWPPGYEEALMYNLALRCAALFPVAPSRLPAVKLLADEAKARIKAVNYQPRELTCEPAVLQGSGRRHWNINSDQVNY